MITEPNSCTQPRPGPLHQTGGTHRLWRSPTPGGRRIARAWHCGTQLERRTDCPSMPSMLTNPRGMWRCATAGHHYIGVAQSWRTTSSRHHSGATATCSGGRRAPCARRGGWHAHSGFSMDPSYIMRVHAAADPVFSQCASPRHWASPLSQSAGMVWSWIRPVRM